MESPLRCTIYDKDLVRTAWVEDFVEHHVKPSHLGLGTATLIVPTDYRKLPQLAADGARALVELERDGRTEKVMSGKIRGLEAEGNSRTGLTTFTIEDDKRLFYNLLGYPSPATWQPDSSGVITQSTKTDDRTGPAETVVKAYLSANLARWAGRGLPITIAPDLGRGSTINGSVRMQSLAEKLFPLLEAAGVGFTVLQGPAGLIVDAYATQLFPIDLSEDGGTVDSWKVTKTPYVATAAVVGGPNTGTTREFRYTLDAVREGRFRDIIETLVDASDQTIAAKILQKATDQLATDGDKWGVELTLTESSVFRYGLGGVHVGDGVAVDFPVDLPKITSPIGEADLSFTREDGYQAKFTVGKADGDADAVTADILAQLVSTVHELRAQ